MRGGFVACIGAVGDVVERAAERMGWHQGKPVREHRDGLDMALFVDEADGPTVETRDGRTRLVHGAAPAPLDALQRHAPRFAALEWDGRRLRASRDPIGLAPLFYRVLPNEVWLATEVRPLAAVDRLTPDREALTAQAAFVPLDDRTGWEGIGRVLAGSTIEIGPDRRVVSTAYWAPAASVGRYRGRRADGLAEFRERLGRAVARRYEPGTGILVSGGLDSAAIVQIAAATGRGAPHLVHVRFPDIPETHEQPYADAVAARAGLPLHPVSGDVSPWDIGRELDGWGGLPYSWLPYGMEEPALAYLAGQGVSVALDGHDGDGVLGPAGAVWGSLLLTGEWRRVGALVAQHGVRALARGAAVDLLPPYPWLRRLAGRRPSPTFLQSVAGYFAPALRSRIAATDIDRWTWPARRWRMRQLRPLIPGATISFEQKELEAARHGIDMRHPFADRELIELLISLPPAVKSDPVRPKAILLDSVADLLPPVLHHRRKSDYMAVVRRRVDPGKCSETIRASRVRLSGIDYERLFADIDAHPARVPLFFLVNLARLHEFARRAVEA
jgi:asparagine synthase (glutamine-hydrolysing)